MLNRTKRELDKYILQFIEEKWSKATQKLASIYSILQNTTAMETNIRHKGGKNYV